MPVVLCNNLYSADNVYRSEKNAVISPRILCPAGKYGTISCPGYGLAFSYFFNSINTVVETGFYYIPGKDELETEGRGLENSRIITAAVKYKWDFRPSGYFVITPSLGAGAAYINLNYLTRSVLLPSDEKHNETGVDPLLSCSISFDWRIPGNIFLGVETGYGAFIEKENIMQFFNAGINLGLRF